MKKFIAIAAAASILAAAVPAMAKFTPSDGADGFSVGFYEDEWNGADRTKTEELYANRPKAERQMENLSRGLIAVKGDGGNLVSWRFLGTDSQRKSYNLYRNGEKLNNEPIMDMSSYFDANAPVGAEYTLVARKNGEETDEKVTTKAWDKNYISIPVTEREGYIIDDGAVGDVDGDGDYEYIIRRTPIGYFDMLQVEEGTNKIIDTRDKHILLEAYETDGTHLWTIDIGKNEANEIDVNFLVYDMDGDGRAEVVMRSYDGMTDGKGNVIGDADADYTQSLQKQKDRQYFAEGNEYLSVFDGQTGEETMRTELLPKRDPLSDWSYKYTDTSRLTKRASHYLFGLAYLDGVTPSVVMVRGAWDNVRAAAWHVSDGKLVNDWVHNTENKEDVNNIWGAWNHNLCVADVDYDGKDEILSGPAAIDHDGSELYAVKASGEDGAEQKLLHGDAFDVAYMDPAYNGYLVWACHETKKLPANIELHDARTGQVKFGYGKNKDTGRSRAADIDPTHRGYEMWGSTGTVPMNVSGEPIVNGTGKPIEEGSKTIDGFNNFKYRLPNGSFEKDAEGNDALGTLPMNFKVYWDGDLLSEFLDGTRVSKWNWNDKCVDVMFDADGCASNGGTKAVPVLSADLFGDWREEIVWKTEDEKELRIYSTAIPTDYKIPTLMHDYYYRSCIAVQNNHYNQPPNVSYYLGAETTEVPIFEGYVIKDGQKVTNPDLTKDEKTYAIVDFCGLGTSIELLINSPNAIVREKLVKIDEKDDKVVPFIAEGDRTLVPVRFISESLGIDVSFDDATREITLAGNGYVVKMTLDSAEYTVNGMKKTLDVPAKSYNGRTMIPLRAMAEAIGKKVHWDSSGYIYIGNKELTDTSNISEKVEILKSGEV